MYQNIIMGYNKVCKVPTKDKLSKWFLSFGPSHPLPYSVCQSCKTLYLWALKSSLSSICFSTMFCLLWQCQKYCILLLWAWSVVPWQRSIANIVGAPSIFSQLSPHWWLRTLITLHMRLSSWTGSKLTGWARSLRDLEGSAQSIDRWILVERWEDRWELVEKYSNFLTSVWSLGAMTNACNTIKHTCRQSNSSVLLCNHFAKRLSGGPEKQAKEGWCQCHYSIR